MTTMARGLCLMMLLTAPRFSAELFAQGAQPVQQQNKPSESGARTNLRGAQVPPASPERSPTATSKARPTATNSIARYNPTPRGRPDLRVSAGSRAPGGDLTPVLVVLAPAAEETGFTGRAQPTLYCYVSKAIPENVEFTISVRGAPTVLLETKLEAGLQNPLTVLDLQQYGTELAPDVDYQWSIAIVEDSKSRSSDRTATGFIRRIRVEPDRVRRIEQAPDFERPLAYEREGLWYDAADSLLDLLRLTPADAELQRRLSLLLTQAGLKEVKLK